MRMVSNGAKQEPKQDGRRRGSCAERHERQRARLVAFPYVQTFIWKEMGGLYPYLDLSGGLLFFVGSFFFFLAPLIALTRCCSRDVTAWVYMAGVVLYTFAKLFVEGRALYAHFFKSRSARVSRAYHIAVNLFLLGGLLFGVSLSMFLARSNRLAVAVFSLSASVSFWLGSSAFVWDSLRHVLRERARGVESNTYMLGSGGFWLGAAFYSAAGSFKLAALYRPLLWPPLPDLLDMIGGVWYLVGSSLFLMLGTYEMRSFRASEQTLYMRRRYEQLQRERMQRSRLEE
eukprot:TRINITY_DN20643_c0_g1_i1.p1 TRINITY_DN20643_c0_g1~~TRINITY_DN20643_c0_g1_i1.p1  ORF type:complete len:287 (-),score=72.54 TRINITY_DN20643_c0_g1_i1:8-868(-)